MLRTAARLSTFLLLSVIACVVSSAAQTTAKPLRASELLALVAGNALPENVVREIGADGLAFRPNDFYRSLLKTAGADPKVLAALDAAKVFGSQAPETASGKELLQHLADAARFMKNKHYDEAASELRAAATASLNGPECYFVAAELLRQQEEWEGAADGYQEVLKQAPDFPEAHTKLSYILYRAGDAERALREARAALERTPDNAEAHKNAALALETMRKFEAAAAEYKEALRLKPDYAAVRYDLGNLYRDKGELDNAIEQYRKSLSLDPNDFGEHNNLGLALASKGDYGGAIREFREAKHVDPHDFDVRVNLASTLMKTRMYPQAVSEFRELEALFPDSPICHDCLGTALFDTWDLAGAEKEYRKAFALDPTDANARTGLGGIREQQKNYDAAVAEYLEAERLDPSVTDAYRGAGRVFIKKGDFADAISQLERAERVAPSDANIHGLYGQALAAAGKTDGAIAEFRESLVLDGSQLQVMLELADALEKTGDWVAAIQEYRKASLTDASIDLRGKVVRMVDRDPEKEYQAAQERLKEHLGALRAAGKASEALKIESEIRAAQANSSLSEQLDAAIQAGQNADRGRDFEEAIRDYQQAVDLAEKMQPHDVRLVTALDWLGKNLMAQNPAGAQAAFESELKAAQEMAGPESPALTGPLQSLAQSALRRHEYATAEKLFFRAVDINEKFFGESSDKVAESLIQATAVYFVQKDYAKAEPYLLRAERIDEALYGTDSIDLVIPLSSVCGLYDHWGKPDKFEPCNRHLLTVLQKQYGENSPVLAPVLTKESQALRSLGRADDAAAMEKRLASIRAATMRPN